MKTYKKIGLFGFGVVGSGFYEVLKRSSLSDVEIDKVCVQRLDLERINHELYFTTDSDELLNDPSIDIIVEAISDPVAAKEIVQLALSKGKAVISANKKMIGESLNEVNEWHQLYEAAFLYEAAVGGGIPIIHNVDSNFQDQEVSKIRGILNGSSNYILTQMQQKKWSFDQALDNAQRLGFAEVNPSLDIDGIDASYKLAILGYHAFGEVLNLKSCVIESIRNVSDTDIKLATRKNQKIKQVATVELRDGSYYCSVKPELIKSADDLFNVDDENNAISIHSSISGAHLAVGKGAGALPTGSAIFADLKRVLNGYKYQPIRELSNSLI